MNYTTHQFYKFYQFYKMKLSVLITVAMLSGIAGSFYWYRYEYPEGLLGRRRTIIHWQKTVSCDEISCIKCSYNDIVNSIIYGNRKAFGDIREQCTRCCKNFLKKS